MKLFEDSGIIERHDFRDGRSRYEESPDEHHDHLIDAKSGRVVEFKSDEIEKLQILPSTRRQRYWAFSASVASRHCDGLNTRSCRAISV